MNIKEALEYGIKLIKENKIDEPTLKARILLANCLNKPKEYLLIHNTEVLKESDINKYKNDIEKICNSIPIQYITKKQEFMGLEFYVDENVLIPQPDTEILVEEVINIVGVGQDRFTKKRDNININILDLCTGSGAIGISIAKNIENVNITFSDISKEALDVAKINYKNIVGDCCPRRFAYKR